MVEELRPLFVERGKVGSKTLVEALEKVGSVITIDAKIMPQPCGRMELNRRYAVLLTQKVGDGYYRVAHSAIIAVSRASAIRSSLPEADGRQTTLS